MRTNSIRLYATCVSSPLSPKEIQLLALVTTERAGRDVAKCYAEETGSSISYGTLYTTFRRLKEKGWVSSHDAKGGDGRVRYFRITGAGAQALAAARNFHAELAQFGLATGGAS